MPFDPVGKRTEATLTGPDGTTFRTSKGMPSVILDLCKMSAEQRAPIEREIASLAARGMRALGAAGTDGAGSWWFLGILPLLDPPREDSKQTMMFLQLVAGGHLLLFITRSARAFWLPPFPDPCLFGAIVGTQCVAVLVCGFGIPDVVPALPWEIIGWVWVYSIAWMFVLDLVKLTLYRVLDDWHLHGGTRLFHRLRKPLGPGIP